MTKMFSVIEYSTLFALRHNPTGHEAILGDGVDRLFDGDGKALVPGTPGFIERWEAVFNADARSTLERYFPEHTGDEPPGHDHPFSGQPL